MGERAAVRGLHKTYGPVVALDGVDLAFEYGSVHALAGPNGSGKTTLLRVLAGLTRPTAGTVERPDGPVGYAFQQPNVYPDLTVRENLDTFARLGGAREGWRERLVEALRLGPVRERLAADLSDGFAKKLDLALAFLREPPVVFLDEPLADLDDVTRRNLVGLVGEYRAPDRLVVVSTHNLAWFDDVVTRLTVVYDGTLLLDESVDALDAPPHAASEAAVRRRADGADDG